MNQTTVIEKIIGPEKYAEMKARRKPVGKSQLSCQCGHAASVSGIHHGKMARCPGCGNIVKIGVT